MKADRSYHPNTAEPGKMIVRLVDIRPEGLDFTESLTQTWLDAALGTDSPFRAAGAGSLTAQLHKVEEVVHLRGRAHVVLSAACSRCLEPVRLELDTPLELAMFPKGAEPAAAADGELQEDDMGVAT